MKYDYVIIGAGVSGMSAAIILAKNGFKVAVVEKSRKTAPLIRGFQRNGFYFDTGFHYTGGLGDGEILDIFFRYLGLADHLEIEPYNPEGFDLLRCKQPEFEFRFPYGYDRIRERLHETFPAEKKAVDTYLRAVRDTYYSFPYIRLNSTSHAALEPKNVNGSSLKKILDELTQNQILKWVLSIHSFLHGVPPEETPFAFHACVVGSYYESVHGLKGGGRSLAEAFDTELQKLQVEIYGGCGVGEILFASDRTVRGVRLANGKKLDCRGCISTIHPGQFLSIIPKTLFRPAYQKRLQRLDETCSAHILYGGGDCSPNRRPPNNLLITSDSDLTAFRVKDPLKHRPFYISYNRHKSEETSRFSMVAICPASYTQMNRWSDSLTGKRPEDYLQFKEEIGTQLRGRIEACCPQLSRNIKFTEIATPLTLRDFSNSPFGSLYGVKHKVDQYNPLPLTKAAGLYLAGQAIVAPGVLGAVISAFLVCGFIFGHERLLGQLKKFR